MIVTHLTAFPGELVHELEDLDEDALSAANFSRIDVPNYRLLKARFLVAVDAAQHLSQPLPQHKLNKLDRSIVTGRRYNDRVADLLNALSPHPPSRSIMGRLKTCFRHIFNADHSTVKQLIERRAGADDAEFLNNMIQQDWSSRLPRTFSELQRLATGWLRDEIESRTSVVAHELSSAQVQAAQEVSRTAISIRFEDQQKERLDVFKGELNQAELDRQDWYVSKA